MAYNKTTWQSGDVVTSAKLNNIESGIANAGTGFDCIIKSDTTTWADATLTLVAGDFASAYAKLTAGTPIVPVLYIIPNEYTSLGPMFFEVEWGENNGTPAILFKDTNSLGSAGAIVWTADDLTYVTL